MKPATIYFRPWKRLSDFVKIWWSCKIHQKNWATVSELRQHCAHIFWIKLSETIKSCNNIQSERSETGSKRTVAILVSSLVIMLFSKLFHICSALLGMTCKREEASMLLLVVQYIRFLLLSLDFGYLLFYLSSLVTDSMGLSCQGLSLSPRQSLPEAAIYM